MSVFWSQIGFAPWISIESSPKLLSTKLGTILRPFLLAKIVQRTSYCSTLASATYTGQKPCWAIFLVHIDREYFAFINWPFCPVTAILLVFVLKASEQPTKMLFLLSDGSRMIDWLMVTKSDGKEVGCLSDSGPCEYRIWVELQDKMTTANEELRWQADGWRTKVVDLTPLSTILPRLSSPVAWQQVTMLADLRSDKVGQIVAWSSQWTGSKVLVTLHIISISFELP